MTNAQTRQQFMSELEGKTTGELWQLLANLYEGHQIPPVTARSLEQGDVRHNLINRIVYYVYGEALSMTIAFTRVEVAREHIGLPGEYTIDTEGRTIVFTPGVGGLEHLEMFREALMDKRFPNVRLFDSTGSGEVDSVVVELK